MLSRVWNFNECIENNSVSIIYVSGNITIISENYIDIKVGDCVEFGVQKLVLRNNIDKLIDPKIDSNINHNKFIKCFKADVVHD